MFCRNGGSHLVDWEVIELRRFVASLSLKRFSLALGNRVCSRAVQWGGGFVLLVCFSRRHCADR